MKLKILLVEDEMIVARGIQNMLNRIDNPDTYITSNGKEAVEKAKQVKPDLVLMDIKLKGDMDGIETAKVIQTHLSIPIIYLTALTDEESLKRARETKPFFLVYKPIDEKELKSTIEKARKKGKKGTVLFSPSPK